MVGIGQDATEMKRAQAAEKGLLHTLDNSLDLAAQIVVKGGRSTRTWNSESHRTVLGRDPRLCPGDDTNHAHLYEANFLDTELPLLVSAFESGALRDGHTSEVPLLHADGHVVWFEARIKLHPDDQSRFLAIFRDITDRRERHLLEVFTLPMTLLAKRAVLWPRAMAPLLAPSSH